MSELSRPVCSAVIAVLLLASCDGVSAQDVRGMEICTVEKQIDRRTSCLQSNVEFLHQTLNRTTREANEKLAAAGREIASAKAELASIKAALTKLQGELAELKRAKPADKK